MANFEVQEDGTNVVNIGYETVVIDKMIGPTGFAPITVTADNKTYCWIVECRDIEVCRIPAQLEGDYQEPEQRGPGSLTMVPLKATPAIREVLKALPPEDADAFWARLIEAAHE